MRAVDPTRLMIADALPAWASAGGSLRTVEGFSDAVPTLYGLRIAQSLHCYLPMLLTHYKAPWVEYADTWPVPNWPYTREVSAIPDWVLPGPWNKNRIRGLLAPWRAVKASVGVYVGEFGCFNQTPHAVTLAWMRDVLAIFHELNVGWALWNLRGAFGVVDSQRADIKYGLVDAGHQVDVAMLNLLKAS